MLDHDNLEAFAHPDEYDANENDAGITFYMGLARQAGGPVLELACGTGRVSIPIARAGFAVTGLDLVPGMLEQARLKSHGLPVRWVHGDARAFSLGQQFRLIFLTGNAVQWFLTRADQDALLRCVRAHLDDSGLFAFETRNPLFPRPQTRADQEACLEQARQRGDWFALLEDHHEQAIRQDSDGQTVRVSHRRTYDPAAQVLHVADARSWREGGEDRAEVTRLALRYTSADDLAHLLHDNGFALVEQYGDWDREPLTAASLSIIAVCRKQA